MFRLLARSLLVPGLALAGCATHVPDEAPEQVLIPVLYATDRNIADETDPRYFYGGDRGPVTRGVATVAVSPRREGESPFADWSRWQPRSGPASNRNELLNVIPLDADSFDTLLDAKAIGTGDRSVLLYVHGFRREFDAVATNVAILAYETNLASVPMLFSWPSVGSVFAYAGDSTSVRWAAADLRDTLAELLANESIDTVHVIAHSLGGNGLLEALDDLSRETVPLSKLGEIVLASPDVDSDLFRRDFLPMLRTLGARVTVYATDNDVPLQASQVVNRYRRLGDASEEIFIADGVETVVFSDVVTFMNSHDAVLEAGDVQADLYYLLNRRLGASERPTVQTVDTDGGRYWRSRRLAPAATGTAPAEDVRR